MFLTVETDESLQAGDQIRYELHGSGKFSGVKRLKEYYEIMDEARPLSGFFPTHADFFMKLSNPPNFRAIRALIASQSTFEI